MKMTLNIKIITTYIPIEKNYKILYIIIHFIFISLIKTILNKLIKIFWNFIKKLNHPLIKIIF